MYSQNNFLGESQLFIYAVISIHDNLSALKNVVTVFKSSNLNFNMFTYKSLLTYIKAQFSNVQRSIVLKYFFLDVVQYDPRCGQSILLCLIFVKINFALGSIHLASF